MVVVVVVGASVVVVVVGASVVVVVTTMSDGNFPTVKPPPKPPGPPTTNGNVKSIAIFLPLLKYIVIYSHNSKKKPPVQFLAMLKLNWGFRTVVYAYIALAASPIERELQPAPPIIVCTGELLFISVPSPIVPVELYPHIHKLPSFFMPPAMREPA